MSYQQVKEILAKAAELHSVVSDYAEEHGDKSGDELFEGLMRVVRSQEEKLSRAFDQHSDNGETSTGETWLQYPGTKAVQSAIDELENLSQKDHHTVLSKLLEAETALAEMFEQVRRETSASSVQALFAQLAEHQQQHVRDIGKSVTTWEQMSGRQG